MWVDGGIGRRLAWLYQYQFSDDVYLWSDKRGRERERERERQEGSRAQLGSQGDIDLDLEDGKDP